MNRSHRIIRVLPATRRRSGFTTPAAAVALLVIMCGLALIVDRIWLETAKLELMIAAESAGLAACRELANDSLLQSNQSTDLRINNALQMAGNIAAQNYVAGSPVTLNTEPEGDVLIGNLVRQSQGIQFVESNENPTTVVITAHRLRSMNNPVGMFLSGIVGIPYADVAVRVEASANNDLVGLRPLTGTPIPALPLAIWEIDPTGSRSDTWDSAIQGGQGKDNYSFDTGTHAVVESSDGIPELVLYCPGANSQQPSNLQLLDLGTGLADEGLTEQCQNGVSVTDLQNLGGQILIGQGTVASFTSSAQVSPALQSGLENLVGQTRICFLYSTAATTTQTTSTGSTANCTEVVAIRILAVSPQSDGSCAITVQPAVMTSRTVMLSTELAALAVNSESAVNLTNDLLNDGSSSMMNSSTNTTIPTNAVPNPYVYKLRITY